MWRAVAIGALVGALLIAATGSEPQRATPSALPRPVPTRPLPPIALDVPALQVAQFASSLSLEAKLRQLLMIHCPGQNADLLRACVDTAGVGGLIFMGDNVPADPAALPALAEAVRGSGPFERLLAIDQEGGIVSRLPWDVAPAGSDLASAPVEHTSAAFASRAALVRAGGLTVNFGVVADVTANPRSFLYDRVLGFDSAQAGERVAAAVAAERGVVASTLKHFPGHGAADGDSHSSLPVTGRSLDEWRANEAVPFRAGIAAGAELVMMSHVVFSAVEGAPASLSPAWHRILRDELGFHGVIVSDDLLMLQANGIAEFSDPTLNAIRALAAGTDLLLFVLPADPASAGVNLDALVAGLAAAVRDGRISPAHLDAALDRVLRLRLALTQ